MKEILNLIYTGDFKDNIGFKWGTLAFLKYGLTRFSTDIDIDLIDKSKEKEVIEFFDDNLIAFGSVEKILGRDLHRWRLHYELRSRIIKIELNKRENPYTQYEKITIDQLEITAQTITSMFSNKLCALWTRRYNRDLYDVNFFLQQWFSIDPQIILQQTWFSLKEWIQYLIKHIPTKFSENTILHQLWEVLEDHQKGRVKKELIEDTIKRLQEYLNHL